MATRNVEFYTRMQGLQNKQHESEQQRMELEHKFNDYLSSDKRLSRLKAAKLQRLWQKVCEDEKRSKIRNQQLLADYHRVEAHVSALSTRTERLRLLKDQYERQVELMYPKWKEQIEARRLQQQLDQQRKQQQGGVANGLPVFSGASYVQPYSSPHNGTTYMGAPSPQYPLQSSNLPSTTQAQYPQQMPVSYSPQTGAYNRQPIDDTVQGCTPSYNTQSRPQSHNQPLGFDSSRGNYTQLQQGLNSGLEPRFNRPPLTQSESGSYPEQMPQYGNQQSKQEFQQEPYQEQQQPYNRVQQHPQTNLNQQYQQQHQQSYPQQQLNHQEQNHQQPPQKHHQQNDQQRPQSHLQQNNPQHNHQQPNHDPHHQQQHQQSYPHQEKQQSKPETLSQSQYRPKADSIGESSSTISISSDSHYSGVDIQPKIVITSQQQEVQRISKPPVNSQAIVSNTEINDTDTTDIVPKKNVIHNTDQSNNNDYLTPMMANGVTDSISTSSVAPVQRKASTGQQGNMPISSRTEPFSSEGEQEETDEEETEDSQDEDSAQLRSALEDQLAKTTDIPVVRVEVNTHDSSEPKEESVLDMQVDNARHVEKHEHKVPSSNSINNNNSEESDSEIGSEMSLPLSDIGGESKDKMAGEVTWKTGQDTLGTTNSKNSENMIANPAVTTKGFWLLTHAVEIEIEQSDNMNGIYDSPNCTDAIKSEIIKSANQNSSLSHLDPNAISMVIIQTLPSIVESLPGGCLLSDKMLVSKRPINEVTVRSFIYSAALGFWDQLIRHLAFLVKKGVFDADEVAARFAPLLINPGSSMADKAVNALCKLLEDIQGEDSYIDDSSSMTLPTPSPSPRKQNDTRDEGNQQHLKVPRLNLGDTDRSEKSEGAESDDNDSFFDSKVPLTETNAYQKMLGNTFTSDTPKSTVKENGDNVDESSDEFESSEDEIEKAARITPQSPSSGANKKKRNVLSSLGGSLGLTNRSDDDDDDDEDDDNKLKVTGGGESTQRSDQVSTGDDSDSSPPGTGYIPSAMEHSMKSTARSDPLQRSAAFWGEESDMESEMSVPMGTMGTKSAEDDKDDFDFYD